MNKYEIDKMIEDGATQLCLNTNGVGCRQVLTVDKFNKRRRQRKDESWNYAFELLCNACMNNLARSQKLTTKSTFNNADFGANNKKKKIEHTGWLGIDKAFFIDVQPTETEHVSRYQT